MAPAEERLRQVLSEFKFRDPEVPIVANCTAQRLTTAQQVKKELADQLCGCVNWRGSVVNMAGAGVSTFVEFGPGRVLSSLVKRITPKAEATDSRPLLALAGKKTRGASL